MGALNREIRVLQNPALGASLIAAAARGFSEGSNVHAPMPLPVAFLVLPIVWHRVSKEFLHGTQKKSGLFYFADKFSQSKNAKSDLLLAVHRRALAMRATTFEALNIAFHTGIAAMDSTQGSLFATSKLDTVLKQLSHEHHLHTDAERLGFWFGQLTPFQLSSILKVAF